MSTLITKQLINVNLDHQTAAESAEQCLQLNKQTAVTSID